MEILTEFKESEVPFKPLDIEQLFDVQTQHSDLEVSRGWKQGYNAVPLIALNGMLVRYIGCPHKTSAPTFQESHDKAIAQHLEECLNLPKKILKSPHIVASAIKQGDKVYTGIRHSEVIRAIVEATGIRPVTGEQGFVTDTGEFVDRKTALQIAISAGQVEKSRNGGDELYAEDLN
jgi:hypothetical protein